MKKLTLLEFTELNKNIVDRKEFTKKLLEFLRSSKTELEFNADMYKNTNKSFGFIYGYKDSTFAILSSIMFSTKEEISFDSELVISRTKTTILNNIEEYGEMTAQDIADMLKEK